MTNPVAPPCPLCKSLDTEKLSDRDTSTGTVKVLFFCKTCACCAPPSSWVGQETGAAFAEGYNAGLVVGAAHILKTKVKNAFDLRTFEEEAYDLVADLKMVPR